MQRGGLAALIRSDVGYEVSHDFSPLLEGKIKTLFILIRSSWSEKLLFGIIYKMSSFSKKDFLDVFERLLSRHNLQKKRKRKC